MNGMPAKRPKQSFDGRLEKRLTMSVPVYSQVGRTSAGDERLRKTSSPRARLISKRPGGLGEALIAPLTGSFRK